MDPCIVLSPHLDDAVLSCGQFLAGRPDATVATLCTAVIPGTQVTTYDESCGFTRTSEALYQRRVEDHCALRLLRASPVHLDLVDSQYGTPIDEELAIKRVLNVVESIGSAMLVGPLGLEHPDHEATARVLRAVANARRDLNVFVYEELPARVIYPELVAPALCLWTDDGWTEEIAFIGTGDRELKFRAIDEYRSQLWALDRYCLGVPERFHRVSPCD